MCLICSATKKQVRHETYWLLSLCSSAMWLILINGCSSSCLGENRLWSSRWSIPSSTSTNITKSDNSAILSAKSLWLAVRIWKINNNKGQGCHQSPPTMNESMFKLLTVNDQKRNILAEDLSETSAWTSWSPVAGFPSLCGTVLASKQTVLLLVMVFSVQ